MLLLSKLSGMDVQQASADELRQDSKGHKGRRQMEAQSGTEEVDSWIMEFVESRPGITSRVGGVLLLQPPARL